jgi:catechol 2,3-dioxygenase-like lactoylglutathione lyase family enzyme
MSSVTRSFEDFGMLEGIHHVEITVKDLDKAVKFYTEKFGLKLVNKITQRVAGDEKGHGLEGSNMIIATLQAGKDTFELIEYTNREGESCEAIPWNRGQMHAAFLVSDVQKMYEDLRNEKGVKFFSPPIPYKNKAKGINVIWCYLRDPEGAQIELIQVLK